ncbi:MAG: nuclear transport factor 2 family protein [Verrucomicrobia bacterium]|jgi:hypothetical protein|nr:nuclear transport factor 2 family protein [Verrucomicrobiota bacterium]
MKRVLWLMAAALVVAGAVLLWRQLFPGPEARIRQRMTRLQDLASFSGSEGNLAALANVQRLGNLFAEDAQVSVDLVGGPKGTWTGRDNIVRAAAAVRRLSNAMKVEFLDVTVALGADGQSATVEATVKVVAEGSDGLWVEDLRFEFIETEEGWLIRSVKNIRTLTFAEPGRVVAGFDPRPA